MSDIAIRVEKLSKQYKVGLTQKRYNTLRDHLVGALQAVFRQKGRYHSVPDTFWALRDVSFEVKQGEILGIIGRNGAGKSTLLKILSNITKPTNGRVEMYGRVGSLLEVGTGFHGELTGRENIYLSGAILGMRRGEIKRKFDEIVAFAEIDKFIDTPVKHYSSGMYVRLAFAVAAHLEPEILLMDEVLAVGDSAFQKKCLGKIGDVANKGGRTVLFVSHNMAAVENLCEKVTILDTGKLVFQSDSRQAIDYYLQSVLPAVIKGVPLAERKDRSGNGKIRLTSFHVEDMEGNILTAVRSGMDIILAFGFRCVSDENLKNVDIGFSVHSNYDQMLFVMYSSYIGQTFTIASHSGVFRCRIPQLPLTSGSYTVGARIMVGGEEADWPQNAISYLDVELGDFYGTGSKGFNSSTPFLVRGQWSMEETCNTP